MDKTGRRRHTLGSRPSRVPPTSAHIQPPPGGPVPRPHGEPGPSKARAPETWQGCLQFRSSHFARAGRSKDREEGAQGRPGPQEGQARGQQDSPPLACRTAPRPLAPPRADSPAPKAGKVCTAPSRKVLRPSHGQDEACSRRPHTHKWRGLLSGQRWGGTMRNTRQNPAPVPPLEPQPAKRERARALCHAWGGKEPETHKGLFLRRQCRSELLKDFLPCHPNQEFPALRKKARDRNPPNKIRKLAGSEEGRGTRTKTSDQKQPGR